MRNEMASAIHDSGTECYECALSLVRALPSSGVPDEAANTQSRRKCAVVGNRRQRTPS